MKLNDITLNNLIKFGNNKLPKSTAIFNLGSASKSCPNKGTERCQVKPSECYAIKSERRYNNALKYRERQRRYWGNIQVRDFILQFNQIIKLKRNPVKALRFNVSSDIRNKTDVSKIEAIAEGIKPVVYLYSASSHVDLSGFDKTIVNVSNTELWNKYRHKNNFNRYIVVESDYKAKQFESEGLNRCNNDCSECNLCLKSSGKIVQVIH